jgi:hypothetical protein
MKYLGCQKAKAFKLFDQGKRPSEIYNQVKVIRHTLYNYYQLWKREREEESERKRLVEERQQRVEAERKRKERRHKEEMRKKIRADNLQAQQRIQLQTEYINQRKKVLELERQMSIAAEVDEIQRIGIIYTQEYEKFIELTKKLYPRQADEKSIEMALWRKAE